jgi:outer membrane receptor protein involved in Fe transport
VLRDNAGALVSVNSGAGNENLIETAGLDIDVSYNTELGELNDSLRGNLNVSMLWTYLDHFDTTGIVSGDVDKDAGEILFPEHRFNLTTTYSLDDLSVVWRMRYWDEVNDSNTPELQNENGGVFGNPLASSLNTVDSIFYHDLQASYDVTDTVNLYFGINNLLDEEPPLLTQGTQYGATGVNTAPEAYDVIGRRYYAGVRVDL